MENIHIVCIDANTFIQLKLLNTALLHMERKVYTSKKIIDNLKPFYILRFTLHIQYYNCNCFFSKLFFLNNKHWTSKSNKCHFAQISMYKTMIILLCRLVQLKIFFKIYLRIHVTFLPPTEEVCEGILNGCQEYINVLL